MTLILNSCARRICYKIFLGNKNTFLHTLTIVISVKNLTNCNSHVRIRIFLINLHEITIDLIEYFNSILVDITKN